MGDYYDQLLYQIPRNEKNDKAPGNAVLVDSNSYEKIRLTEG